MIMLLFRFHFQMFLVVEFTATKTVGIISHAWYLGDDKAAWPLLKPSKMRQLLKSHELPPSSHYTALEVKILKPASKKF